ncbi:MAG: 50S ribosomal protein L19e [Candidatus Woesearchaeota archaeon]
MLNSRKRIAGKVLKRSPKRVWLDPTRADEIKESITKVDIRGLIKDGVIRGKQVKGVSRARAKKRAIQRRKGRGKGPNSRKGKWTARLPAKVAWMNRIRLIRKFLAELKGKELITKAGYRKLYLKAKGGFFRSKRHVKLYIDEQGLGK